MWWVKVVGLYLLGGLLSALGAYLGSLYVRRYSDPQNRLRFNDVVDTVLVWPFIFMYLVSSLVLLAYARLRGYDE